MVVQLISLGSFPDITNGEISKISSDSKQRTAYGRTWCVPQLLPHARDLQECSATMKHAVSTVREAVWMWFFHHVADISQVSSLLVDLRAALCGYIYGTLAMNAKPDS